MRINKLAVKLAVATILTLSSSQAMASKYWTDCNNNTPRKWPGSGFTFNANPAGFDGQYAFWRTSFATALTRFNDTPVNLTVNVRLDNDTSVGVGNGESEIWWNDAGNSATGYNITSPCGTTIEGDIVFHNTVSYDDSMDKKANFWNYGGNSRTFESTALHEVGHTVGLAHENRYYNIMGTDYTHLHTTGENALRSYLGEDAVNGLIALYGGSNREDLSVAAWRHVGSSGAYSTHGRTRLFNGNGTVLNSSKVSSSCTRSHCELRYNVELGETIQYEMTLENNGRNSQSVALGYYISTNAAITTTDTLISTDNVTVTRNTPDTVRKTITIPNNLTPNTDYYLGVIIDNSDSVSEWTEKNNTSYMHIRTGSATQSQAPTAEANGPYNGSVNSAIAFSSSGSNDSDGSIASYNWNFGDGNSSTSANPNHSYSAAGSYTVNLTVTDNDGLTATDTATTTITTNPGTAYCTSSGGGNYEWIAGVAIGGVNNSSAKGGYSDYTAQVANLNSGSNSATLTPGFTSGAYTEYWSVWIDFNKDGDFTDSGEQLINGQSSKAAISANLNIPTSAAGVNGARMRIAMKYGSAASSACENFASGEVEDYSVNIVGSGGGNQSPISNANGPYAGNVNTNINFNSNGSADTDGNIAAYSWNFGDGNSSTTANPSHSYSTAGSYTAVLTVTDNQGASSTDSATVTISSSTGGSLENACTTEGATSAQSLASGDAICVPNASASTNIQYYYIYVDAGTNSIEIESDHGTGNADIYYKAGNWATASSYDQRSSNSGNTESITVSNPTTGWQYITVIGARTGMTLKVTLK